MFRRQVRGKYGSEWKTPEDEKGHSFQTSVKYKVEEYKKNQ
jgi:hypothetical protein